MPVSDASARRAAGWLAAWARAGLLGSDPEVAGFVADLIRFVGERVMSMYVTGRCRACGGATSFDFGSPPIICCGCESDSPSESDRLADRARELEAENARLREGLEVVRRLLVIRPDSAACSDAFGDPYDLQRLIAELLGDSQ